MREGAPPSGGPGDGPGQAHGTAPAHLWRPIPPEADARGPIASRAVRLCKACCEMLEKNPLALAPVWEDHPRHGLHDKHHGLCVTTVHDKLVTWGPGELCLFGCIKRAGGGGGGWQDKEVTLSVSSVGAEKSCSVLWTVVRGTDRPSSCAQRAEQPG